MRRLESGIEMPPEYRNLSCAVLDDHDGRDRGREEMAGRRSRWNGESCRQVIERGGEEFEIWMAGRSVAGFVRALPLIAPQATNFVKSGLGPDNAALNGRSGVI